MSDPEKKIYLALLVAGLLMACFLVFFIYTLLQQQRRNQLLQKEKTLAEINTLEKERTRIAADLHDDLGPMLSSVKLLINNLDQLPYQDQQSIDKANDYIDAILAQLRGISNDLMPQALLRKGLVTAVEDFINDNNEKGKMQIGFRSDAGLPLTSDQDVHLYRIIHEVIHNAEKHAGASGMHIDLNSVTDKLVLKLKDNGRGFDPKNPAFTQKGLGLKNILSRVETMNGELFLASGPDKGTEYLIEIPLQRHENNDITENSSG